MTEAEATLIGIMRRNGWEQAHTIPEFTMRKDQLAFQHKLLGFYVIGMQRAYGLTWKAFRVCPNSIVYLVNSVGATRKFGTAPAAARAAVKRWTK